MRKLQYSINLEHFRKIKNEIIPSVFTEHQFKLIEKRMRNKKMTASEKNEFSRTVSKKMKAINRVLDINQDNFFIYGQEKIRKDRLDAAINYVKQFSRQFKDKHVFLSGSFLHQSNFNDIDIFVVSKYDKEDYHEKKFHINYLTEDVYNSLFFASISKLCVSNQKMLLPEIKEPVNTDTLISLYQELFNDLDKNFAGIRATLRDFLLQASFIENKHILDSLELRQLIDAILKIRNKRKIVQNIFITAITLGQEPKKVVKSMKQIILSYKELMKEYSQHKKYYTDLIRAFTEVIAIES